MRRKEPIMLFSNLLQTIADAFVPGRHYCPLCGNHSRFKPMVNDVESRKAAKCPTCGSFERHRFLYYVYKLHFLDSKSKIKVLHIAPERPIYNLLQGIGNIEYTTMDLHPRAFRFAKNIVKGDILHMPFGDEEFDFVLHNQVLEHIGDEKACIDECLRVLKPDGKCIMNIPYDNRRADNFEDERFTTAEQRKKHYYQEDHVRLYGKELLSKYEGQYNLCRLDENLFPPFFERKLQMKRHSVFLQDAYYVIGKRIPEPEMK